MFESRRKTAYDPAHKGWDVTGVTPRPMEPTREVSLGFSGAATVDDPACTIAGPP